MLPGETTVTIPEDETDAIAELLLVHVPPETVSVKVVALPAHNEDIPEMVPATGNGSTSIEEIAKSDPQLLDTEYVIKTLPEEIPKIEPNEFTVAIDGSLLIQEPPDSIADKLMSDPTHTDDESGKTLACGSGFTVTD